MSKLKPLSGYWWVLAALALYLPLIFQGYGSDNDTYRVLNIGRHLLNTGDYGPSRQPGYLVHEMATLGLNQLGGALIRDGGSIFTNLGTLLMALVALGSFNAICRSYRIRTAPYLVGAMLIHPVFWVNAGSTIDFVWALGLTLAGFALLLRNRFVLAGLLLGLSIGARLTSLITVAGIYLFLTYTTPEKRKRVLLSGLVALVLGSLCYIPSFVFSKYTLGFLGISTGEQELWTDFLRTGRFFYKNIYFWGLLPAAYLACLAILAWKQRRNYHGSNAPLSIAALSIIAAYELLFFRYPIESDYLLATLPFWLLLLGIGLEGRRGLLAGLAILLLFSNFVTFNIARPDIPNRATGVSYGLWVQPGPLLEDLEIRQRLLECDHIECYKIHINPW